MNLLFKLLLGVGAGLYADEPAPAGTPAPTPTPATSQEGSDEDFEGAAEGIDWGAMNADVKPGADEQEGEVPVAPTPTPPVTQAKATPTPTPTPVEGKEAEKPTTQEQTPAPATAQEPAKPALTPEQQAEQDKQFTEWEKGEVEKMATQYASSLSDDDVAALQTEPEKVLPRLAAQIRMDTMKATLSAIGQLLPGLLSGHQVANQREAQAQEAFFSKNEDLKDVPIAKIMEAGRAYRQMNPEVKDPEEVIEGIGNMVRAVMKRQAKQTPPPAAAGGNGRKKGYTPAGTGASTKKEPEPDNGKNVWSELADDD